MRADDRGPSPPPNVEPCAHDSLSGDEGPVRELGRMPVRWRCDECNAVIHQCSAVNGCRCLLLAAHTGDHQCPHGYWLNLTQSHETLGT